MLWLALLFALVELVLIQFALASSDLHWYHPPHQYIGIDIDIDIDMFLDIDEGRN